MAASLELAITAIRSGRKEEGRQLLNLLIQQNPNDEQAWLWMSSVVNTDEQRARCLYHVLAINPINEVARKGLKILGIVVTDSRPVKIPRDSQPIQIPKPTPQAQAAYPQASQLDSKPVPVSEEARRPFRIDPQTITKELPFTPVREPFAEANRAVEGTTDPSKPVPAAATDRPSGPAEPVPADQPASSPEPAPLQASPDMEKVAARGPDQAPPAPQPPAGGGPYHETRPSQPVPIAQPNPQPSMSQPGPHMGPGNQYPYPAHHHSQVTMGMPNPYYQPANPSQPVPGIHSNPTMGMSYPGQGQDQMNRPGPPPSEPVPAIHSNGTMPMPAYPQAQYQPIMAAQPSMHSSATMAVPMGYDPFAGLAAPSSSQDYHRSSSAKSKSRGSYQREEDEDEDEVNILAVIIFGSLSVTALGGLGMLILLMFTTG
jgi:hypothetical protein